MNWSSDSAELKKHINAKVPLLIRSFVDRVITRSAEALARARGSERVEREDVIRSYGSHTPQAMRGLLLNAMKEKEIDPADFGFSDDREEKTFPIGEPMTREEIQDFLNRAVTGRLGTCADGQPYVVPLSFVYLRGSIYYHWFSDRGRKTQNIQKNSRVCFEADESTRDHVNYRSVIADGTIGRVTNTDEKTKVMRALAQKFPEYATCAEHDQQINEIVRRGFEAMVEAVEVYRIDIQHLSGKKKGHL